MPLSPLPVGFYNQSVHVVARALLGTRLVRVIDGQRVGGYITETESYAGESDLACHARAGRTPRTEVMYGRPGKAYVYFIYGIHWMLNVVAEPSGSPAAVLIRAILPVEGLAEIARRRTASGRKPNVRQQDWTNGPARLCTALAIDGSCNGADLTGTQDGLWIEPGLQVPDAQVITGPRVGIQNVPEPWRSKPWRFRVDLQSWNLPQDENRV
jgi:DNA-3-methyladenine glycosylase